MKGNLRDFTPTQVLSLVSLAKKTGTLDVERKDGRAKLVFQGGKLVYASIGEADGSLASVLARAGRLNKEQAASLARYAARSSDKQLGLLLIEKKYFTQADIIQSIKRHALGAVNQFASWREGTFVFEVDRLAENGRITVPIDLENVIIQIARLQKLDDQLEEEIPSLDVSLKFANRPNVKLADLQLTKDEWRVLNFIKPGNTIRMIATTLGLSDKQIRRVIGSLREAGLVELAQAPRRDTLTAEERQKKRQLVGRLIQHLQGMSAE